MYKHLFVHIDATPKATERIRLAVKLALRFGARLTALFAQLDSFRPRKGARGPSPAEDFEAACTRFEEQANAAGLQHDVSKVPFGELEVGGVAARFCRYGDLTIVGQPDPDEPRVPQDLASQILLESGRPVLLVPAGNRFEEVGRRVVVAWAGTRESARALGDAIPLMRDTKEVLVLDLQRGRRGNGDDAPAPEVVEHLAAHGILAQAEPTYTEAGAGDAIGMEALDVILNRSADMNADLVVLGARGRHGVPFPQVGRSARRAIDESSAPILLTH
jgi:nucleotide-binding universal stress UspA family protein